MHNLVNAGADILELGVPFSDPQAEGQSFSWQWSELCKTGLIFNKFLM